MTFVSYAQNFEDVLLWRALSHIDKGTYIDIGAQHPLNDSVSMAFYERGWRGLHVEPVQYYADLLRTHRQDEIVIQAALSSKKGRIPFFELPNTGLSTGNREIFQLHCESGVQGNECVVEAITLASLFSKLGRAEIHWMKIDVEGMELEVLRGWRQSKTRPWIVVIESTIPNSQVESYESWEPELVTRGYEFAYFDGLNRFYVSAAHKKLLPSLRSGPNYFDRFVPVGVRKLEETAHNLAERNAILSAKLDEMSDAMSLAVEGCRLAWEQLSDQARKIKIARVEGMPCESALSPGEARTLRFARGQSTEYLISGFSMPESWGTWSNALISRVDIPVNVSAHTAPSIVVRMPISLHQDLLEHAPVLKISSHGVDICFVFFRPDALNEQEIVFSMQAAGSTTSIVFELTHLSSPATRREGSDSRLLGFRITSMHVEIGRAGKEAYPALGAGPILAIGTGEGLQLQHSVSLKKGFRSGDA